MTLKEFIQSFNEVEFKEIFHNPNTFSIHQIVLYYHLPDTGQSTKFLKDKCKELGLDIKELVQHKFNSTHKVIHCKQCGKELILLNSSDIQFCSTACGNRYRDLHRTPEEKEKIRQKVSLALKKEHKHICPKCGKEFMHIGTSPNTFCDTCYIKYIRSSNINKLHNHNCRISGRQNKPKKFNPNVISRINRYSDRKLDLRTPLHQTTCKGCGKELYVKTNDDVYCFDCSKKLKKHQYLLYTSDGHKLCSDDTREKLSLNSKKLMAEGKIKPWQSRNIISYAERFFRKVLSLNHIAYKTEVPVIGYFLDFELEVNGKKIDLEIDGKQHWCEKDRIEHDRIRDEELKGQGYIIYRIPWNGLNNLDGKVKMKNKIQEFLQFYSSI